MSGIMAAVVPALSLVVSLTPVDVLGSTPIVVSALVVAVSEAVPVVSVPVVGDIVSPALMLPALVELVGICSVAEPASVGVPVVVGDVMVWPAVVAPSLPLLPSSPQAESPPPKTSTTPHENPCHRVELRIGISRPRSA